jgi:hypothetical protein
MDRCVTSVKTLSHGRHLPIASVARVIIRQMVIRLAFRNAFNTFSTTLIAFSNFKHSANDAQRLQMMLQKVRNKMQKFVFFRTAFC